MTWIAWTRPLMTSKPASWLVQLQPWQFWLSASFSRAGTLLWGRRTWRSTWRSRKIWQSARATGLRNQRKHIRQIKIQRRAQASCKVTNTAKKNLLLSNLFSITIIINSSLRVGRIPGKTHRKWRWHASNKRVAKSRMQKRLLNLRIIFSMKLMPRIIPIFWKLTCLVATIPTSTLTM